MAKAAPQKPAAAPDPVSPLGDHAMPRAKADAGITLSERLPASLVQVQAWPGTVAAAAKVVDKQAGEGVAIMASGPGRWLIESDTAGLEDKLRKALKAETAAVTGLTHARTIITARGPRVDHVLASGLAVDFAMMEVGEIRLTHHHEIGITLRRLPDVAGAKAYDLIVFTSFALSFWEWIARAGEEVGLAVA